MIVSDWYRKRYLMMCTEKDVFFLSKNPENSAKLVVGTGFAAGFVYFVFCLKSVFLVQN